MSDDSDNRSNDGNDNDVSGEGGSAESSNNNESDSSLGASDYPSSMETSALNPLQQYMSLKVGLPGQADITKDYLGTPVYNAVNGPYGPVFHQSKPIPPRTSPE